MTDKNQQEFIIYPGSFDPITNGHINIVERGIKLCKRMIVAVADNPQKKCLFSVQERMALLKEALAQFPQVEVDSFSGLLMDYARSKNAKIVLRGLRAVSDFEYEFQMAHTNRNLNAEVETIFMMTGEDYFFLSSHIIKEIARFRGPLSNLVPWTVEQALNKKFLSK